MCLTTCYVYLIQFLSCLIVITPETLSASSEQDIIDLVELNKFNDDPTSYCAILINDYNEVELLMDKDPGSGYQRSNESTLLKSEISLNTDFVFAIRSKNIFDRIKELLGKKRPKTGNRLFDKRVVISSSDDEKLLQIIDNSDLLKLLSSLSDFSFAIKINEAITNKHLTLEFSVNNTESDKAEFQNIYHAFCVVLNNIQNYNAFMKMSVWATTATVLMKWSALPTLLQ